MSIALLIVGVSTLLVGIAVLNRCHKIFSCLEWLQRRFLGESPHLIIDQHPALALDFFTIQEKLAPLFFMPLASTAMEIKRMYEEVKKPFFETLEAWREFERKEMEAFAAVDPPDGKGFTPSDDLKKSLKAWSGARYRANVIEKWTYLFTETYVALLSGKITLSEAEGRLKRVNSINLAVRDHFAEAKIFNSWAANWEAGNWRKRLHHLREIERGKPSK